MTEAVRSGRLDIPKFPKPVAREVIDTKLLFGPIARDTIAAERQIIRHGFPSRDMLTTDDHSLARAFVLNTAGTHARLWREGKSPSLFITYDVDTERSEVQNVEELWRSSGRQDPWLSLAGALNGMFVWSLEQEADRLSAIAATDPTSVPANILQHLEEIENDWIPSFPVDALRRSIGATANIMSVLYKMAPVLVEDNGVTREHIPGVAIEVAANSYRTIEMLMKSNNALRLILPMQFASILERSAEASKDLFQLEIAPDGSAFINLSEKLIDHMFRLIEDASSGRRICPAGRVVFDQKLLPKEWADTTVAPFAKDMWDEGLKTAEFFYKKMYPVLSPEED